MRGVAIYYTSYRGIWFSGNTVLAKQPKTAKRLMLLGALAGQQSRIVRLPDRRAADRAGAIVRRAGDPQPAAWAAVAQHQRAVQPIGQRGRAERCAQLGQAG